MSGEVCEIGAELSQFSWPGGPGEVRSPAHAHVPARRTALTRLLYSTRVDSTHSSRSQDSASTQLALLSRPRPPRPATTTLRGLMEAEVGGKVLPDEVDAPQTKRREEQEDVDEYRVDVISHEAATVGVRHARLSMLVARALA